VTTGFFPNCVSVFSRKVEASLPGPCPGGPTCQYRTESYRSVSMWKIPFTDRDTDRYRFRVPTEFTDLPTLL